MWTSWFVNWTTFVCSFRSFAYKYSFFFNLFVSFVNFTTLMFDFFDFFEYFSYFKVFLTIILLKPFTSLVFVFLLLILEHIELIQTELNFPTRFYPLIWSNLTKAVITRLTFPSNLFFQRGVHWRISKAGIDFYLSNWAGLWVIENAGRWDDYFGLGWYIFLSDFIKGRGYDFGFEEKVVFNFLS